RQRPAVQGGHRVVGPAGVRHQRRLHGRRSLDDCLGQRGSTHTAHGSRTEGDSTCRLEEIASIRHYLCFQCAAAAGAAASEDGPAEALAPGERPVRAVLSAVSAIQKSRRAWTYEVTPRTCSRESASSSKTPMSIPL